MRDDATARGGRDLRGRPDDGHAAGRRVRAGRRVVPSDDALAVPTVRATRRSAAVGWPAGIGGDAS
ncbi:hypothetical protein Cch01nite_35700 [Cellulomonas chitinilytica]|uniref:Uncharacterized protein n=1 Tax=Cellulomonas chitinilytica TaxID=398759 RepID=A0A919P773_9CELL|nr:hypothetical protein [Cellulomonas chitinilytica]GIG22846.1 hypothetical protein Cch01nite_35700 [Cellulomonas chitinilytica]